MTSSHLCLTVGCIHLPSRIVLIVSSFDVFWRHTKLTHAHNEFGEFAIEESLSPCLQDLRLCIGGHKIAKSALIIDHTTLRQLFVGLHGGVDVHLQCDGIVAHPRNTSVCFIFPGQYFIANALRNLIMAPMKSRIPHRKARLRNMALEKTA